MFFWVMYWYAGEKKYLIGHARKVMEVHNILCVQEVVTILYSNLLYKMRHYSWTYTVRPGSSDSFFIASILYKMGHFFLDILYIRIFFSGGSLLPGHMVCPGISDQT